MTPDDTEKVCDERTFRAFLNLLYMESGSADSLWENKSLPDFIEAIQAWLEDTEDHPGWVTEKTNPWKRIADALAAARIYE